MVVFAVGAMAGSQNTARGQYTYSAPAMLMADTHAYHVDIKEMPTSILKQGPTAGETFAAAECIGGAPCPTTSGPYHPAPRRLRQHQWFGPFQGHFKNEGWGCKVLHTEMIHGTTISGSSLATCKALCAANLNCTALNFQGQTAVDMAGSTIHDAYGACATFSCQIGAQMHTHNANILVRLATASDKCPMSDNHGRPQP